ncbi:MAG: hypothetical protein PHD41_03145 [Methanosarcinaceae archaeon]|nr:hypothetical protein [Methanosarcinaceae archaeon]MDD4749589.1 hypothetical protein [Methanosarcinaceae archaeon]
MKERMRFVLALGLLLLSGTLAINLLLENAPVVIQIDGDTFKVVDIPYVYTVKDAYILLFSGFFAGVTLSQLLAGFGLTSSKLPGFRSEANFLSGAQLNPGKSVGKPEKSGKDLVSGIKQPFAPENNFHKDFESQVFETEKLGGPGKSYPDPISVLLIALEGDERRAVEFIEKSGGQILQNELVNSLNFSRAKVSRILTNLEKRGIISKRKYGLTNCISISDKIRGSSCPEGVSDEE